MDDDEKTEKTEETGAHEEHKHHHEHKDEEAKGEAEESSEPSEDKPKSSLKHKSSGFLGWFKANKKVSIPASVAVFLLVFFAIPFTRYMALGLFLKQEFSVVVVDSQTGKPVSAAQVSLRGQTASTDGEGKAAVRVPVGESKLSITKAYYNSFSREVVVTLGKPDALNVKLEATGRPVPVSVINNITRQPVANAVLSAGQSQAKTDDKGQATLVVPIDVKEVKGTLSGDGFNQTDITVKATTEEDDANKFGLTPTGRIYFLSNKSGKVDVIESDLDGKNRKTFVKGTGKERDGTELIASRDWKYLSLRSRRDGGDYDKLFLVDTAKGSMTVIDEGKASFRTVGWEGHYLVYEVNRSGKKVWEPKQEAIKSYNADARKLTTLDETAGSGSDGDYINENFSAIYLIDGKVIYTTSWDVAYWTASYKKQKKSATLESALPNGSEKKVIKSFTPAKPSQWVYVSSDLKGVDELYLSFTDNDKTRFYSYKDGQVRDRGDLENEDLYGDGKTYHISPSGKQTFWSETRDGKTLQFLGDSEGQGAKDIGEVPYGAFGWFTDQYLLLGNGSELYIMPVGGVKNKDDVFKVTDYYSSYSGGYDRP